MKLLIINGYGQGAIRISESVPRIGDTIDIFYAPMPKVNNVIWWPTPDTIEKLNNNISTDIDVIIFVS